MRLKLTLPFAVPMLAMATAVLPAPAMAEEYTIFVYETPADLALRSDTGAAGQAYWAAYAKFAAALAQANAIRGGAPLALPERTAGPDPVLGGYFVIDAPDRATAERLAALAPSVSRGGRAELRATYPAPAMQPPR